MIIFRCKIICFENDDSCKVEMESYLIPLQYSHSQKRKKRILDPIKKLGNHNEKNRTFDKLKIQ